MDKYAKSLASEREIAEKERAKDKERQKAIKQAENAIAKYNKKGMFADAIFWESVVQTLKQ